MPNSDLRVSLDCMVVDVSKGGREGVHPIAS